MEQLVAREDHSLEVIGSSPISATQDNIEIINFNLEKKNIMDRESLRPLVEAQYGESRITVLSEETINAELDAELEGITDDSHFDEACCKRIAQRLLRMNGNVAKEAGTQINDWKKKHPAPQQNQQQNQQQQQQNTDDDDPKLKAMRDEIDELKKSLKQKDQKEADDKIIAEVRSKFNAKFKESKIEVKNYFADQVFGRMKLPTLNEGETHDVAQLAEQAEKNYFEELKKAGIKYEKPHKQQPGGDTTDKAALAKREAYKAKLRARGKLPKVEEEKK